ncbi:MAG: c-type cytochrome [Limnobacter sp.]|nr:c-type cytochrome [Limnobacter sp.]
MTAKQAKTGRRRWLPALAIVVAAIAALAALVAFLNLRGESPVGQVAATAPSAETIRRGAYLALAGNCAGCHTAPDGTGYAGGRGIETPFGVIFASNLTPDPDTGIGDWSADEFWRAMHNGRSKDGRLLYPAFPYPNYTQVTREDSDAIYAFLQSLPPVVRPNRAHALRFPYGLQASLAVWRALFFKPAAFEPDPARPAEWNRGAYLVRSLGHCGACHSPRNFLGAVAPASEFTGGPLSGAGWYAPSLKAAEEAGVAHWEIADIVSLLQTGQSQRASAIGPMAEVVFRSTQHLDEADLQAMAVFLKSLSPQPVAVDEAPEPSAALLDRGREVYEAQCANCHGDEGEGAAGAYAPLAGNRAVTMASSANVVRMVLDGGFTPSTTGNPRPYGMPPFAHSLDNADIAAVVSYIRNAWGNRASQVSPLDLMRYR